MKEIPKNPGVYIFKDKDKKIIYVGKAKNLKNRVSSYFNSSEKSAKTKVLTTKIKDMDHIIVNNEVEALLLENKLIKEHTPKYNINLKDDKTYAYIKVTDEKFPRIISTRKVTKKGKYFGPYTDNYKRAVMVKILNKHYKLCTKNCMNSKSRLSFDIGLCKGACIGKETPEEYKTRVEKAIRTLKGDITNLKNQAQEKMLEYIEKEQYELAKIEKQIIDSIEILLERQRVDDIRYIDQDVIGIQKEKEKLHFAILHIKKGTILKKENFTIQNEEQAPVKFVTNYYYKREIPHEIIVSEKIWRDKKEKEIVEEYLEKLSKRKAKLTLPIKGDKKVLADIAIKNASVTKNKNLNLMQEKLELKNYPKRIECFDISNLKDEHIVAGMVSFVDGEENKKGYRRFKIKSKITQDDFAAMGEVVYRRYRKLKEENNTYPDLIIIDGGKGQVNAARLSLKRLNIKNVDLIGIAKKEEEIIKEDKVINLDKQKEPILTIRKIRDEVHRFAITYNRLLRSKEIKEGFKK